MTTRVWMTMLWRGLLLGVPLFLAAGTLRWPAAWLFLAELFAGSLVFSLMLARRDPALLAERLKSPFQRGQPSWDRAFMIAMLVLFPAWFALMGLDAVRFRWSRVPDWLQIAGAFGVVASLAIGFRVFLENTFLAPVVRIQGERGHRVISTGPYAVVRHPLYSALLVFLPSAALMLGSWWGLLATIPLASLMALRSIGEERELRHGLRGYEEYTRRVRFRMIPRVW